jgi:carbamoyltransferase
MSRIVNVKSTLVPGVTHVDNTARIQTVAKEFNPKFYLMIEAFYKVTGIPMLLNTSFNCQEPIVETPDQAMNTFKNTELDILVVGDYIVRKKND